MALELPQGPRNAKVAEVIVGADVDAEASRGEAPNNHLTAMNSFLNT